MVWTVTIALVRDQSSLQKGNIILTQGNNDDNNEVGLYE